MARTLLLIATLALAVLPLGQREPPQNTAGTIAGIVLRSGTSVPVEGARVSLSDGTTQLNSLTDREGRFAILNIPAGRYSLRVQRDGYFTPREGIVASPSLVIVNEGQQVRDLRFTLVPGGTISGRVLDPRGRPLADVQIAALRLSYVDGRPRFGVHKTATTNDRGDYRLFWLEPGRYYIRGEKASDRTTSALDGYLRSYFPGTSNTEQARHVEVVEDTEAAGIDFAIQSAAVVKVSGTVFYSLPAAGPLQNAGQNGNQGAVAATSSGAVPEFILSEIDAPGIDEVPRPILNALNLAQDRGSERFEIRGIRPGRYDLYAMAVDRAGSTRPYWGSVQIQVDSRDLEGISLFLRPGTELKGRLVHTGRAAAPANTIRLQLQPRDAFPASWLISGAGPTTSPWMQREFLRSPTSRIFVTRFHRRRFRRIPIFKISGRVDRACWKPELSQ